MTGAFTIVVIIVAVVGVAGALAALLSGRRTWEAYGRDHLLKDSDLPRAPRPASRVRAGASETERDEEIRQMLEAGNARRRRRGQPEVDIEAELARLTAAGAAGDPRMDVDEQLRGEIRELVIARHRRRARRDPEAAPPLDIEAEVEREIARLTR